MGEDLITSPPVAAAAAAALAGLGKKDHRGGKGLALDGTVDRNPRGVREGADLVDGEKDRVGRVLAVLLAHPRTPIALLDAARKIRCDGAVPNYRNPAEFK